MVDVDVLVGGGGVAGLAAAVAMEQLGNRVVVIEPGLHEDRRLAGEVFHPPGVEGLAELGILPSLTTAPAVTVEGFSVWMNGDCFRLPYSDVTAHRRVGLCLRHDLIRERMMNAVKELPNITVKHNMRVVGIDQSESSNVVVNVANGSEATSYRCRMLVAADGTSSRLARMAGICVLNRRISTIIGYRIRIDNLPEREFGHVILGPGAPILLYPIDREEARILFDLPYQPGRRPTTANCISASAVLPPALRGDVARAIATQRPMSVISQSVMTAQSVNGRVALVGDAGGACHPLTATGMSMCINDALILRAALSEQKGDVPAALRLYHHKRRWPQATRLVLADALRDAFCGASSEQRILRDGILSHLRCSPAGRSATLALLSTADSRPLALLRQFVIVMLRGYIMHLRHPLPANDGVGAVRAATMLVASLYRRIRQVLRGTLNARRESVRLSRHPVAVKGSGQAGLSGSIRQ